MTTLKEKLEALKTEALQLEADVKGVNGDHSGMMDNLNKIETFIKDSKEAIEKEATEDTDTLKAYDELKEVIDRLKTEVNTLKTQNNTLKAKVASIASLCVFSGAVVGVLATLGLKFLKGVINKHKGS